MAETADAVVVRLEADLADYNAKVSDAARQFDASIKTMTGSASQGEQAISRSFNNARLGQMEFSHVIRGTSDALAAGMSPLRIFAQEIGRVGEAVTLSGSSFGKFGEFLSGPWGIAVSLGVAALAAFIGKHHEATKTLGEMIDKLAKDAEKTETSRIAHLAFTQTLLGQIEAQKKLNETLEAANESQEHADAKALAQSQDELHRRQQDLAAARKQLADAQAALADVEKQSFGVGEEGAAQRQAAVAGAQADVDRAQAAVTQLQRAVKDAEQGIRDSQIKIGDTLSKAVDPIVAINIKYNAMADAAKNAAKYNNQLAASIDQTLASIERQRQADIKAERERQALEKSGDITQFQLPVSGPISSSFGAPRRGYAHKGIDIAVPVGTDVEAAAAGTVIEIGNLPGYGNVVIIDHGRGTTTRYGHLSQILATKGQTVTQGQVIGLSGGQPGTPGAGDATGPHVHYEVRLGGRPVDPRTGQFPTDSVTAANKAKELQDKELANEQAYSNEVAQLNKDISAAKAKQALTADQLADVQRQEIKNEHDAEQAKLENQHARGIIDEKQLRLLEDLNNQREKAKLADVDLQEEARLRKEAADVAKADLDVAESRLATQREVLASEAELAPTTAARKEIEKKLLDLQFQEEKIRSEAIIAEAQRLDAIKNPTDQERLQRISADAAAKAAKGSLASLPERQANASTAIDRKYEGPYDQFRRQLADDFETVNKPLQQLEVDSIKQLEDSLASAATKALGLSGALGNIVQQLIKIGLEREVIGPLADILFGGAGSGGTGGIFGGLLAGAFGIPARASGGDVSPGRLYRVNEGAAGGRVEGFVPAGAGKIIPLGQMAAAAGGHQIVLNQTVNVDASGVNPEGFAEHIRSAVRQETIAIVSSASQATLRAAPGRQAQLEKLGT